MVRMKCEKCGHYGGDVRETKHLVIDNINKEQFQKRLDECSMLFDTYATQVNIYPVVNTVGVTIHYSAVVFYYLKPDQGPPKPVNKDLKGF